VVKWLNVYMVVCRSLSQVNRMKSEIRTCTCGRKIRLPLGKIEDVQHLMQKHKGYWKLEPAEEPQRAKEGWMTQVFYLPESTWK